MIRSFGLCASFLLLLPCGSGAGADNADDKKNLQGKWALVKIDNDGKLQDVAKTSDDFFHMRFEPAKVTTEFTAGKEEGTYKIDPGKKPKTIDITANTSDDKGKTFLGIYTIEGDTLKLCMAEPDVKERPADFKAKKDKVTVFVLKRVK